VQRVKANSVGVKDKRTSTGRMFLGLIITGYSQAY
jgi:hypothetical protein